MDVTRIINGLERSDADGPEARAVAQLGFLEWAFTAEGAATPQAARHALAAPEVQNATSAAARAFVGFLRQATCPLHTPATRRGRARRVH